MKKLVLSLLVNAMVDAVYLFNEQEGRKERIGRPKGDESTSEYSLSENKTEV